MKKIEYQAPEMEVIKLEAKAALLNMSNGENGGANDPSDW